MTSETPAIAASASPVSQQAVKRGMMILALFSAGHFVVDLYSSALGIFQPLLVDKLHLNLTEAGILGGLMVLFSSVMQPAWGYLSDRFHTRAFSVLAPAVAGIFISALGLAASYEMVLLCIALGGMGIASFHPQASVRATMGISKHRGRWMAVFISSGTLGMALGPIFFSTLISWLTFEGIAWGALLGILATLLMLAKVPSHTISHKRKSIDWAALKAVRKPLIIHYFLVFVRSVVQIVFAQMLPLYFIRERGFSLTDSSFALSLYLTAGAVGGFLGGQLADRFGGKKVIQFSMISCLPFLALFFLTHGWLSLVGLTLGGLTLLFTIPVNVTMAQDLVPSQAGTVSALMMGFAWGMAGLLFIPLTGWIADHSSLQVALGLLAFFPLIGFVLAFGLPNVTSHAKHS